MTQHILAQACETEPSGVSGSVLALLFVLVATANVAWQLLEYAAERRLAEGGATPSEMRKWIAWARRAWGRKERL